MTTVTPIPIQERPFFSEAVALFVLLREPVKKSWYGELSRVWQWLPTSPASATPTSII